MRQEYRSEYPARSFFHLYGAGRILKAIHSDFKDGGILCRSFLSVPGFLYEIFQTSYQADVRSFKRGLRAVFFKLCKGRPVICCQIMRFSERAKPRSMDGYP